jgi:hypothetical protein
VPTTSIIIPTRNRAALLQQTLDSVRAQTISDWEAIVIDDHSTDETESQTREASSRDSRIRYLQIADKTGAPAARNLGVKEAQGEYIIFLDSDDLLAPHCLEQRMKAMTNRRDLDFSVFPCQLFRQTPGDVQLLWNCKTDENDLDRFLKMDVAWQTTSPIWRRESLGKFAPWDESVLSGQDWEFHIRAIVAGLKYEWFESSCSLSPVLRGEGWGDGQGAIDGKQRCSAIHASNPSPQPSPRSTGEREIMPDCFWRLADAERESIGKQSFGPEHLRSRKDVIGKMLRTIEDARLMTPARKAVFAGMYFQLAERTAQKIGRKEARQIWRETFDAGLIDARQLKQGTFYFRLYRWPSLYASKRRKLEREWPAEFFVRRTATYV